MKTIITKDSGIDPINDLYVIQDDLDMDVGKIKICYNHNSGGHNGIKNITPNKIFKII